MPPPLYCCPPSQHCSPPAPRSALAPSGGPHPRPSVDSRTTRPACPLISADRLPIRLPVPPHPVGRMDCVMAFAGFGWLVSRPVPGSNPQGFRPGSSVPPACQLVTPVWKNTYLRPAQAVPPLTVKWGLQCGHAALLLIRPAVLPLLLWSALEMLIPLKHTLLNQLCTAKHPCRIMCTSLPLTPKRPCPN